MPAWWFHEQKYFKRVGERDVLNILCKRRRFVNTDNFYKDKKFLKNTDSIAKYIVKVHS